MLSHKDQVRLGTFLRTKLYGHPLYRDLVDDIGITPQIEPAYLLQCLIHDLGKDELLDILALGLNSSVHDIINNLVEEIDHGSNNSRQDRSVA